MYKRQEVTYTVGAENAFPQINELSTLFPDFFARATQKGSVDVGAEGSRWYQDAALTQPATMPQGEAGANYVIYCRFSVGLNISQINNNAENTSYAQIRSVLNLSLIHI